MWMAAIVALAAAEPVSPTVGAVPAQIEEHYRDYNFVSAFSTARERQTLAAAHEAPADPRLARIARLMRRLEADVDEVDPGITHPLAPQPYVAFRSDLLRISSCRVDADKGEAWVHLDVLSLDQGANVTLVGQYDALTSGGRMPSVAQLLAAQRRGPHILTQEIHRWTRVDGTWRRAPATFVFVKE